MARAQSKAAGVGAGRSAVSTATGSVGCRPDAKAEADQNARDVLGRAGSPQRIRGERTCQLPANVGCDLDSRLCQVEILDRKDQGEAGTHS